MNKYFATISRYGFVEVEAEDRMEAMEIVNGMATKDISWFDDWEVTDVYEDEEE